MFVTSSEQSGLGGLAELRGINFDVKFPDLLGAQFRQPPDQLQEALLLRLSHDAFAQHPELADVLFAPERTGAERMGVRHGYLVLERRAVLEGDDDPSAERLHVRIGRVVAAGPLWGLARAPLAPAPHR